MSRVADKICRNKNVEIELRNQRGECFMRATVCETRKIGFQLVVALWDHDEPESHLGILDYLNNTMTVRNNVCTIHEISES